MNASLHKKVKATKPIDLKLGKKKIKVPANSLMKIIVNLSEEKIPDGKYLVQNSPNNDRTQFEVIEVNDLIRENGQDKIIIMNNNHE